MQVRINCQVLPEQTSDSFDFLNVVCPLKYVLNCEQHFPFFIFQSGLTVTGLAKVYCRCIVLHFWPVCAILEGEIIKENWPSKLL
jgi:hypothetical protein